MLVFVVTGIFIILTTAPSIEMYNQLRTTDENCKSPDSGIYTWEIIALVLGLIMLILGAVGLIVMKAKKEK